MGVLGEQVKSTQAGMPSCHCHSARSTQGCVPSHVNRFSLLHSLNEQHFPIKAEKIGCGFTCRLSAYWKLGLWVGRVRCGLSMNCMACVAQPGGKSYSGRMQCHTTRAHPACATGMYNAPSLIVQVHASTLLHVTSAPEATHSSRPTASARACPRRCHHTRCRAQVRVACMLTEQQTAMQRVSAAHGQVSQRRAVALTR